MLPQLGLCDLTYIDIISDQNIDCSYNRCQNGATCLDHKYYGHTFRGYSCICSAGFTGAHCSVQIDYCKPNPCQDGGTCVLGSGGLYSCYCRVGWTGKNCDKEITKELLKYCIINKSQDPLADEDELECSIGLEQMDRMYKKIMKEMKRVVDSIEEGEDNMVHAINNFCNKHPHSDICRDDSKFYWHKIEMIFGLVLFVVCWWVGGFP